MDALNILYHFYPEDTPLRQLLLKHSTQVRDKALAIRRAAGRKGENADPGLVAAGALLHDIGIGHCHAPKILCTGTEDYMRHGIIGARLLRGYGAEMGENYEPYARICERHTGSGLTAAEIRAENLPLPEEDFLPETPEETLICLADKFFSKSGDLQEKSLKKVRKSMEKFGEAPARRLEDLLRYWEIADD